jgi:hypothetical protein
MSDDFQRGLQARLAHLIGEASQWSCGSGAHPPGLVKALNEAFEYGCAEIERLQRERDALKAENEQLREALEPFADVAEYDIGGDEADTDLFRPIDRKNAVANQITVGDMRKALSALAQETGATGHE